MGEGSVFEREAGNKKSLTRMGKGFMERVTRLELASRTPLKLGFSGGPAPLD